MMLFTISIGRHGVYITFLKSDGFSNFMFVKLFLFLRNLAPEIGDETRQILGLDLPANEEDVDSAYDDPRTESIRSRTRTEQIKRIEPQVFHQLNVELSESEDPQERKTLNDDIDSAVKDLSLKFDQIEIPQPRPFEGSSLHLGGVDRHPVQHHHRHHHHLLHR